MKHDIVVEHGLFKKREASCYLGGSFEELKTNNFISTLGYASQGFFDVLKDKIMSEEIILTYVGGDKEIGDTGDEFILLDIEDRGDEKRNQHITYIVANRTKRDNKPVTAPATVGAIKVEYPDCFVIREHFENINKLIMCSLLQSYKNKSEKLQTELDIHKTIFGNMKIIVDSESTKKLLEENK